MAPKKAGSDHDGASPGKIFVGGLSKDTSLATFYEHFAHYGTITDHVIMKDRDTHRPRGFGFITYADPAVVDKVIEETHVINDKQVEIKRTIPKSSAPSRDIKTKKIFVGGIPASVNEDELKNFFTKYGKVVDQEILRDHTTKRSRGFGFVIFDSENVVDELLAKGNKIDFAGSQGKKIAFLSVGCPCPLIGNVLKVRPYIGESVIIIVCLNGNTPCNKHSHNGSAMLDGSGAMGLVLVNSVIC